MRWATDVLNDGLHILGAPDAPLKVVIGQCRRIEGSVVNTRNEPSPTGPLSWCRTSGFVREPISTESFPLIARAASDAGASPGDYKLFAWNVETGAWQDSDLFRFTKVGRPLRISEGSSEIFNCR
jgi:hypothetical protein